MWFEVRSTIYDAAKSRLPFLPFPKRMKTHSDIILCHRTEYAPVA